MSVVLIIIALLGALFTTFALVRMLLAMRAGAPRELVIGWMALMIAGAVVIFVVQRLLG